MTLLWKCLWELYNPGVVILSEQNPQSRNENARNWFPNQLKTRKIRNLMRRRKTRKRMSPWEPPHGPLPDQRRRGNGGATQLLECFTGFSRKQLQVLWDCLPTTQLLPLGSFWLHFIFSRGLLLSALCQSSWRTHSQSSVISGVISESLSVSCVHWWNLSVLPHRFCGHLLSRCPELCE